MLFKFYKLSQISKIFNVFQQNNNKTLTLSLSSFLFIYSISMILTDEIF